MDAVKCVYMQLNMLGNLPEYKLKQCNSKIVTDYFYSVCFDYLLLYLDPMVFCLQLKHCHNQYLN